MTKMTVRFFPAGKVVELDEVRKISQAAELAGVKITLPCNGRGRCGRCGVYITQTPEDGSEPNLTGMERVLACRHDITGDIDVFVPLDEYGRIVAGEDQRKVYDGEIVPIVKAKGKTQLGLAVDLGTAAIAVSILDLKTGFELYSTVGDNPQSFAGDDLESRKAYADEKGGDILRKAAIDKINDLMYTFVGDPDNVKTAVISGKPYLMASLTEVCSMTGGPFCLGGSELGLDMAEDAPTFCVKELSEEVGGDLIGGILACDMDSADETILLIDIGSTVQLALGNKESILVCSSESGPALEGGNVIFGMTPSIGAIDSVQFKRGRMSYTVIGGTSPAGICGSGLIDLVSGLYASGFIDIEGKFTKKAKIFESENGKAFGITDRIYVTEADVAAVMRAKAAVCAGILTLLNEREMVMDDISRIVLSGSFGIFINVDNAIALGMLPEMDRDRFNFLGNASMTYARNAMLSENIRDRAEAVRGIINPINFRDGSYDDEFKLVYPIPEDGSFISKLKRRLL
ncbi:MAG: ASKHA domain-containing protein [Candidatus Methanomethylophilaceae archaeon]